MVKAVEKIQPVIDENIHSPLTQKDVGTILAAHKQRKNTPDYIIDQIWLTLKTKPLGFQSSCQLGVRAHGDSSPDKKSDVYSLCAMTVAGAYYPVSYIKMACLSL